MGIFINGIPIIPAINAIPVKNILNGFSANIPKKLDGNICELNNNPPKIVVSGENTNVSINIIGTKIGKIQNADIGSEKNEKIAFKYFRPDEYENANVFETHLENLTGVNDSLIIAKLSHETMFL